MYWEEGLGLKNFSGLGQVNFILKSNPPEGALPEKAFGFPKGSRRPPRPLLPTLLIRTAGDQLPRDEVTLSMR